MQSADYNQISKIYDDVRNADMRLVRHLLRHLPSRDPLCILDIGCGTGNYTNLFQITTEAQGCIVCGMDPSESMLAKACQKNSRILFRQGTAEQIPWRDELFDFVYMTDVIHHVPDIEKMFAEIRRVLAPEGQACIVTQSHRQIQARPIARFFPGTVRVDQQRYPDIGSIIAAAQRHSLTYVGQEVLFHAEEVELSTDFLELVRKKGYSMLGLLPDDEFELGLRRLEEALHNGPVKARMAGETLLWFTRQQAS